MVFRHLRWRLGIGSLIRSTRVANDVRLNRFQTFDKVRHIDHQIALDWEITQCFHLDAFGVIAQEGFTCQLRHFVDHHAAGAADCHAAGPAVAQVRCQVIFDIAERIQQGGLLVIRHFIESAVGGGIHFRIVAHHFNFQFLHLSHSLSPSSRRLLLLRRTRV